MLPAESRTVEAVSPLGGWSRTDMLLARICEGIEMLLWTNVNKGARKSRQTKRPERIPRPGVEPDDRRIGSGAIPVEQFIDWYFGGDD